jgi:E3 ubiquitin-protein ligase RNF13
MAELAGASAAIVYDDVYEALIIMSKPRDHPDPEIPAVFVSEKAGIIMRKLMTPGVTRVRIVPVSRVQQQLWGALHVCTAVLCYRCL